jgi:hypothetical protein
MRDIRRNLSHPFIMEPFRPLVRSEYNEATDNAREREAHDEQNRRHDGAIADRVYLSRPEKE